MRMLGSLMLGLLLVSAPVASHAEGRAPIIRKEFKLDPESGCFRYTGNALEFVGRFKAGAYVHVTMDNPERIPVMNAPEYKASGPGVWYGPLDKTGAYSITFYPSFTHGSVDSVSICGRVRAPDPMTGITPDDAQRLYKAADEMMATDPYSQALLDEPKALIQDEETLEADVCGFPVKSVVLNAVNGSEANPLQPRVTGTVQHFANVYESPFSVVATCVPVQAGQQAKKVGLSDRTRDCYFAGQRLECSYLAEGETVSVED